MLNQNVGQVLSHIGLSIIPALDKVLSKTNPSIDSQDRMPCFMIKNVRIHAGHRYEYSQNIQKVENIHLPIQNITKKIVLVIFFVFLWLNSELNTTERGY